MFNLVGRVVPVLDAALKLGLGRTERGEQNCVVVADVALGGENAVVGILVEALGGVVDDGDVERLDLDAVMETR